MATGHHKAGGSGDDLEAEWIWGMRGQSVMETVTKFTRNSSVFACNTSGKRTVLIYPWFCQKPLTSFTHTI